MNISDEALINKCANLYQIYVISQDVEDRNKYLKLYNTFDKNLRNLELDIIPTYNLGKIK